MIVLARPVAPLGELIGDAVSNLYALRQRSVLALLGIVIGTASVVAMLTIGHMAERESVKLFSHMGVDMLVVQATAVGGRPIGLDRGAVESLPQRRAAILQATALMTGRTLVANGRAAEPISVVAAAPALRELAGFEMRQGRFLSPLDAHSLVAVIGAEAAGKLSTPGRPASVGGVLQIGRYGFTIVGVFRAGPATAFDPVDFNNAVVIPLEVGDRGLEAPVLNAAMARMSPGQDAAMEAAGLLGDMRRSSPAAQIEVQSARKLIETLKAQKAVHTRLLAAIGGISLLVGGIGVMNVMLMSVMERRREIGLRAALGAAPADIQWMFLVEAAALAGLGGAGGVVLGLAAALAAALVSHWTFSLALYAVPLGAGVAMAVGVGFGLYPAVKASQLDPIEALRAE